MGAIRARKGPGALAALLFVAASASHAAAVGTAPAAASNVARVASSAAFAPVLLARGEASAAKPAHRYALAQGHGIFGYEIAISRAERARGILDKPPVMVRVQSMSARELSFIDDDASGSVTLFRCHWPCRHVDVTTADGETTRMPVASGTIVDSVIRDARNGYLRARAELPTRAP